LTDSGLDSGGICLHGGISFTVADILTVIVE